MKLQIKDNNNVEWTYDCDTHRFYVAEADKEFIERGEDPKQNGYYSDPGFLVDVMKEYDFNLADALLFRVLAYELSKGNWGITQEIKVVP